MKDIILDPGDNNDLLVRDGDFVIDESLFQHMSHIVEAVPGQYKQWPLLGFGLRRYLNGPIDQGVIRNLRVQLKSDKLTFAKAKYQGGVLAIEL